MEQITKLEALVGIHGIVSEAIHHEMTTAQLHEMATAIPELDAAMNELLRPIPGEAQEAMLSLLRKFLARLREAEATH